MPDGIDLKRIIDLDPETTVTDDDYTIVDSATGGAKKFALGQALNDLNEDITNIETTLDSKANIDGSYDSMTVGNAKQLVSSVGIGDSVPYNFRTSGGSVDIGDRLTDKVVGGTIAWNQMIEHGDFDASTGWSSGGGALSISDSVATVTLTGASWNNDVRRYFSGLTANHVYLWATRYKMSSGLSGYSVNLRTPNNAISGGDTIPYASNWSECRGLCKPTSVSGLDLLILGFTNNMSSITNETFMVDYVELFDLTQMFGSTIADYIYSLEQSTAGAGVAWFKKLFPKPYYAYDAGSLQSVQTSAHNMVGFNAWDEEWEIGVYDSLNGEPISDSNRIRCKNPIQVIGGTNYRITVVGFTGTIYVLYYDANDGFVSYAPVATNSNKTIPQGVRYLRFYLQGTYGKVYNHDICINLSWDGERDGEYEPYVKHTYPLDSDLVLRGIPKLDSNNELYYDGDTYESDGTVTRKYGIVTLNGTETWDNRTAYTGVYSHTMSNMPNNSDTQRFANIISDYLPTVSQSNMITSSTTQGIAIFSWGTQIVAKIKNITTLDAFKAYLVEHPLTVIYPLATPTTETADPYQNPQIVDDFGTEEYVDAGSRDVAIPVGHETFYAANLKAKLEMSPDSPSDGNGDYIVRQTNGTNEYVKMVKELPSAPTTDGSYHLEVTVASGTPTLTWVADE